jgi:hypothetical protein
MLLPAPKLFILFNYLLFSISLFTISLFTISLFSIPLFIQLIKNQLEGSVRLGPESYFWSEYQ